MAQNDALRGDLIAVWERHREAGWPKISGPGEGELMTLDTVIAGCMVYFLDSTEGLDPQRIDILESCLEDLDHLLPDLGDDCSEYFGRLRLLGGLLLKTAKGD
ncbi:hypothetical protein [Candidatus Nitrospira bockiana]